MQVNDLIRRIDVNQSRIQSGTILSEKEQLSVELYNKLLNTYTSNAIEGNRLTLDETMALYLSKDNFARMLIHDDMEALGHFQAHDYMIETAHENPLTFSEEIVKKLHFLFYRGIDADEAGAYRQHQVFITGAEYIPPEAADVPALMVEFLGGLNRQRGTEHPVLLAAYAHRRLAEIHPFVDGNGRTARLLMNMILVNAGYCIVSIPPILRHAYISTLLAAQRAKNPSDEAFIRLICECEMEAQKDHCRMLRIPLKSGPDQAR